MKLKILQALILCALSLTAVPAFAADAVRIYPTINSNGSVVLSTFPSSGCTNSGVGNARIVFGSYPAGTIVQNDNTNTDNCQTYLANYNSGGNLNFETMAGTFDGDGSYFLALGGQDNAAQPLDPSHYHWYVLAVRSGGTWALSPAPDTSTRIISYSPANNQTIVNDGIETVAYVTNISPNDAAKSCPCVFIGFDDDTDAYAELLTFVALCNDYEINLDHPEKAIINTELEGI